MISIKNNLGNQKAYNNIKSAYFKLVIIKFYVG